MPNNNKRLTQEIDVPEKDTCCLLGCRKTIPPPDKTSNAGTVHMLNGMSQNPNTATTRNNMTGSMAFNTFLDNDQPAKKIKATAMDGSIVNNCSMMGWF